MLEVADCFPINPNWNQAMKSLFVMSTQADVSYGSHAPNVLDFWQAQGDGPRPLLVYIHGGGWTGETRSKTLKRFSRFSTKGFLTRASKLYSLF